MIEDSEEPETRSSGDLWSEICSSLPEPEEQGASDGQFTDSFQPPTQETSQTSFTSSSTSTFSPWEPMADSEVYIASLENRLKRIKGQSNEVTSREMLRSLSQAKKECWDRFLHDAQTSELFQEGGDLDQSALEQLKRWLSPERVAISAEELEYLLLPSQRGEGAATQLSSGTAHTTEEPDEEESSSPEK